LYVTKLQLVTTFYLCFPLKTQQFVKKRNETRRGYTCTAFVGITGLVLLMLVK